MTVALLAARLPAIEQVRRWSQSLAVLDAILSPDWEMRYFSFDPVWSEHEQMASMRNGSGDEYAIVFSDAGAYVRGFDHESPLSPWMQNPPQIVTGLVDALPQVFADNVTEPAFSLGDVPATTVCLWRQSTDDRWSYGEPRDEALRREDGGAAWLFEELDGEPATYASFARDYYEVPIQLADVEAVFAHQNLSSELVARINPEADTAAVAAESGRIGYRAAP